MSRKPKDDSAAPVSPAPAELSEATVAAYLRRNPDFLVRHPELLDVLEAPKRDHGAGVVDLQHAMMERLRGELANLRESRDDLIQTGRANMNTQSRIHEAVLALLHAKSFEHLIETVTTDLVVMLDIDAISICVEQAPEGPAATGRRGVMQMEPNTVDRLLGVDRSHVLIPELQGRAEMFGEAAALINSAALLRLDIPGAPPALLAMGTRTAGQFDPGQGTELLRFLADSLALTIRRWLELPA